MYVFNLKLKLKLKLLIQEPNNPGMFSERTSLNALYGVANGSSKFFNLLITWDLPVVSKHPYLPHWCLGKARTSALGFFGLDSLDSQGWPLFHLPLLYFRLSSLKRPGSAWENAIPFKPHPLTPIPSSI